jgi:hypothetical protein
MAEAIGAASGLLTLATFALQSSTALYSSIQSFKNRNTRVRDLENELSALTTVLESLTETITSTTDVNLSALKIPLERCDNACKDFEQEIAKCLSRSGGSKVDFRDWAKLRYMGEDIDEFRRLIVGYKSTINIALADANL